MLSISNKAQLCCCHNLLYKMPVTDTAVQCHSVQDGAHTICANAGDLLTSQQLLLHCQSSDGRDSSLGIAIRYGLNGPGIESPWEARFSAPVQTCRWAHPASCTTGTGSLPGVKRPGRGVDHPPPPRAEVKERLEPGTNLDLGRLGSCLGR